MTTQTRPSAQPTTISADQEAALLQQLLSKPPSEKYRIIDAALQTRIEQVEEVLPDAMKGQARRLVKRAMMTFSRRPEIGACPAPDFIRCVIEAGELGLAIDGKLAYVVPYDGKWQLQLDYKGVVAVAKRAGLIRDAIPRVVYHGDQFDLWTDDSGDHIMHRPCQLAKERGPYKGAYAKILPVNAPWRYQWMPIDDIYAIRDRSAAYKARKGPWLVPVHEQEMIAKTVLRRAMKLYSDDPAISRAMELTERDESEAIDQAIDQAIEQTESNRAAAATQERLEALKSRMAQAKVERQPGDDGDEPSAEDSAALDWFNLISMNLNEAQSKKDADVAYRDRHRQEGVLGPERCKALDQLYLTTIKRVTAKDFNAGVRA